LLLLDEKENRQRDKDIAMKKAEGNGKSLRGTMRSRMSQLTTIHQSDAKMPCWTQKTREIPQVPSAPFPQPSILIADLAT
jgi:hypothetical protein